MKEKKFFYDKILSSFVIHDRLITEKDRRLTSIIQLEKHPFFRNIEWKSIRDTKVIFAWSFCFEVSIVLKGFSNFEILSCRDLLLFRNYNLHWIHRILMILLILTIWHFIKKYSLIIVRKRITKI